MARDHGFGCEDQMQGQMHVHATEMGKHVPLLGHFFRRLEVRHRRRPGRPPPPTCRRAGPHSPFA
ncbi:hypothetical protein SGPA1_60226 [Streptomyces misionensis JCM 4497]